MGINPQYTNMKNYSLIKKALLIVSNVHGSGINSDYTIEQKKDKVEINNCFAFFIHFSLKFEPRCYTLVC